MRAGDRLRVVARLTVALAATVLSLLAVSVPSAFADLQPVDLGANTSVAGINAVGQAIVYPQGQAGGLWTDGTITHPLPPTSDPTATFAPTTVNDAGVVVGTVTLASGDQEPGYWDSAHSSQFVEISLAGLPDPAPGDPWGLFSGGYVDAAGELVGSVQDSKGDGHLAGLYVPAVGGLPAGTPQLVTQLGGADVDAVININGDWELGQSTFDSAQNDLVLLNRQSGAATTTDLVIAHDGGEGPFGIHLLSPDGAVIGTSITSTGVAYATLRYASGSETNLNDSCGNVPVHIDGITGTDVPVGAQFCASGTQAISWDTSGRVTDLNSLLAPGSGWVLQEASETSDGSTIAGSGTLNGVPHAWLVQSGLSLSISHAVVAEPAKGSTPVTLQVSLSAPSTSPVTVDYSTEDGAQPDGATAAEHDYTPTSGTLTFAPGETSKTITVQVNATGAAEDNEGFSVELSNPSGAEIATGSGTILIDTKHRAAAVAVQCLPQSSGSQLDACTVAVTDTSGKTPPMTPGGTVTVTATGGSVATPGSCTLSAGSSPGSAACQVLYTPPPHVGMLPQPPVMTADYAGDANFVEATGTETLDCTSGAVFQLDSVTGSLSHGRLPVGGQATLSGCGFTTRTYARFGDDASIPFVSAVSSDGKTAVVTVPPYAIDGPLTVKDASIPGILRQAVLSAPNPLLIDSWRNTDGFSFVNHPGQLSAADLLREFPSSDLTVSYRGHRILRPWADRWWTLESQNISGLCFGMALTSGEFADGTLSPSRFSPGAQTGFEIPDSRGLDQFLARQWLAQFSDQFAAARTARANQPFAVRLAAAMGSGAFQHPAIISMQGVFGTGMSGHAEVAYGYTTSAGGTIRIFTADSNLPFAGAEDTDTTGKAHFDALERSWITVNPNVGTWDAPTEGLIAQPIRNLKIVPVSALERQLTLTRTIGGTAQLVLSSAVTVESDYDGSGKPLSLTGGSPQLTVEPDITSPGTEPVHGRGLSGIGQLIFSGSRNEIHLDVTKQGVAGVWQASNFDAGLSSDPGQLAATFDAARRLLEVAPLKHAAEPRRVSASLTAKLHGDRTEHIFTVSGPADVQLRVRAHGQRVTVFALRGGSFAVTLQAFTNNGPLQQVQLRPVRIHSGRWVSIQPKSWQHLRAGQVGITRG